MRDGSRMKTINVEVREEDQETNFRVLDLV